MNSWFHHFGSLRIAAESNKADPFLAMVDEAEQINKLLPFEYLSMLSFQDVLCLVLNHNAGIVLVYNSQAVLVANFLSLLA